MQLSQIPSAGGREVGRYDFPRISTFNEMRPSLCVLSCAHGDSPKGGKVSARLLEVKKVHLWYTDCSRGIRDWLHRTYTYVCVRTGGKASRSVHWTV